MELFFYIIICALVYLIGILFVRKARTRLLAYTGLSVLFVAAGLILYLAISAWVGLTRFGAEINWNMLREFFNHGAGGVAALVIIVLGMLSPLAAAWITGRLKTGHA